MTAVEADRMDPAAEQVERSPLLLQALTTEHFTLKTARAATIADSNGRAALYLSTVSGAVVALAFIGQVAHVGPAFFLFTLALLLALVLLGVLTYLRLLQTAVEDLFYARAINRIRRHYVDLAPDAARWFLLTGCDDPPAYMVNMGLAAPEARHTRWHLLSHTATMVAVVTSIIGGVFVALTAHTLSSTTGLLAVVRGERHRSLVDFLELPGGLRTARGRVRCAEPRRCLERCSVTGEPPETRPVRGGHPPWTGAGVADTLRSGRSRSLGVSAPSSCGPWSAAVPGRRARRHRLRAQ
jgi:hypothetical protein